MVRKIALLLMLVLLPAAFPASALIYKNQGCGHCVPYIEGLMEMLERNGYTGSGVVIKDYMQDPAARSEFYGMQQQFGVPLEMQGHMAVLLDGKYLFEGHVPTGLIEGYIKSPKGLGQVVVTQDNMGDAESYLMLMDGKVETCPIGQPIQDCDGHGKENGGGWTGGINGIFQNGLLPLGMLLVAGGAILYYIRGD